MSDSQLQIAKPMEWLFMLDTVRRLHLTVIGPFDAEELKLIEDWFKLVQRTILREEVGV